MTNNSNGRLSEYFANDPPSFFDELTTSKPKAKEGQQQPPVDKPSSSSNMLSTTFTGTFQPPEYVETAEAEEPIKVSDDVRNLWQVPTPNEAGGLSTPLVMPGIHIANDLPDPISIAVTQQLGEAELQQRQILGVENVTQDERGIRTLINAGCFRAAVNLTGRLLTIYGQGYGRAGQPAKHSPHSLQLWFTRLALLAKLDEYDLLQAEAEPFGQLNGPDVFYEFYPEMYNGKQGSIACFSFRLLLAELPIYLGKPHLALDQLSELHVISNEIKQHYEGLKQATAAEFWQRRAERVLQSIINCALMMKKFSMIDDIMGGMLLSRSSLSKEEQRSLYSAWGRIYLQIGDIFGAEQKFAVSRRLREINSTPDLRDLVDKGLIAVAKNDFPEAYLIFQKALHLDSGNTMILNNMGVCLLYAGKLKDAINLYERAINLNPQKSLNESLLVNLSTLYELESNNSKAKKLNLLRLINRFKPDLTISVEICLKLQATN
ncbi:trafficking protein particle complex subunit 12 [Drosophila sulfurigaster albostrigata]|uniref:trafficking protein particle complex subunit 12 n=1 Tax=Drosophila sulfurigaster albostrigata TaxID=89887 RepID=UPI002D21CD72|nr:trafficking protein particle complex subunit 12 [Drosophila sulfurigaster albostrigata]